MGKTNESTRRENLESLVESCAALKAQRPVSYGDVEYHLKTAPVEGMTLQIDKKKIVSINDQIKMMRDQEVMFVLAYMQDTYQSMILGLINGLLGLVKQQAATANKAEELEEDSNNDNNN